MKNTLVAIFCSITLLTGCLDISEPGSTDSPPVVNNSDYTQNWVGRYNGASDIYDAYTGTTRENRSTVINISKQGDNKLYAGFSSGNYTATVTDQIFYSSSSTSLSQQNGAYKYSISMNQSGNNLSGTFYAEKQMTSGGYELMWSASFNCSK
jgi:hypothetical protein